MGRSRRKIRHARGWTGPHNALWPWVQVQERAHVGVVGVIVFGWLGRRDVWMLSSSAGVSY